MRRTAPLLAIGALAVHQLRYALDSGGTSPAGHAYLGPVGALVAGVTAVALAVLLARVARGSSSPAPRLGRLWSCAALALIAVYAVQELAEGTSPVAHGGWLAAPLAVLIGLAIALLGRGAAGAHASATRPWRAPLRPRHVVRLVVAGCRFGSVQSRLSSARGPPPASA